MPIVKNTSGRAKLTGARRLEARFGKAVLNASDYTANFTRIEGYGTSAAPCNITALEVGDGDSVLAEYFTSADGGGRFDIMAKKGHVFTRIAMDAGHATITFDDDQGYEETA